MLAFSSAVEVLRQANRVLGYEAYRWRVASESGGAVEAICGLSAVTNSSILTERRRLFEECRPSMVVICADQDVESYSSKPLEAWLRECRHCGVAVSGVGTATYILAKAGLLNDKHCTIHWENLPGFSERYMEVPVNAVLYQVDGNIWTCAGGSASLHMMLHLVQRHFGDETVAGICEQAIVERVRAPNERQRLPLSQKHGILNPIMIKLIEQMEDHLAEPLSIEKLAKDVKRSRRQVERLFRSELGRSPLSYYRELRLERARMLLTQSAIPIVDIAIACGFISASHFSKSFRETYGMAPQEIRRGRATSKQIVLDIATNDLEEVA
ncbi:GlxA family transcriptional regulator [Mesorhizobium sp. SARCC-RB16n]|uniref:GlxA family transcriptional regulator n=1 Tax=Mesorhizobium sp. SARCC-RB16n TaxID=2116687 RepID=UPI001FEF485F|nr:GlxA family transcriptional regulator [Mesorhizobium sp. SARCC-RB16n]